MPLHLLGKKSWNPYSPAAIARVRADEADAAAREEAYEQTLQTYEATRRRAILKGETPPDLPPTPPPEQAVKSREDRKRGSPSSEHLQNTRKRRRLAGEDDTDRDIRFAREDEENRKQTHETKSSVTRGVDREVAVTDNKGNIQLFPPPDAAKIQSADQMSGQGKSSGRDRFRGGGAAADEGALKFRDANGLKSARAEPWYANSRQEYSGTETIGDLDKFSVGKDAFGRDDPNRKARDSARLSTADPMAAMKKAQVRLKEVAYEKKERENALREMRQEQDERTRRKPKKYSMLRRTNEIDPFSLDCARPRQKHRHHHKHSETNTPWHDRKSHY